MPRVRYEFRRVQAFYDSQVQSGNLDWFDIGETLGEKDSKALEELVQMVRKDKMTIVEIGSWKGYSTSILAKRAVGYSGKVFAVDHWRGGEGTWQYNSAKTQDVYARFRHNMIALGFWDTVHPLVMDSETASQIFADGILDMVFIDGDHRYKAVKKDILSWLPKLKDGGILCGHDCEGQYSHYSEEVRKKIDEHLGDDYINDIPCHPGVVRALYDRLQDKHSLMPDSTIFYYIKKE